MPLVFLAIVFVMTGCDINVTDLNNPSIEELIDGPNRQNVSASTTGLLVSSRVESAEYVAYLGILGREDVILSSDPRLFTEYLAGEINPGSFFGGLFWDAPYSTIRAVHLTLDAVENTDEFSPMEKAGIRGFAKTIQAIELMRVITTRDENGVVIDTEDPVAGGSAIVSKAEGLAFVAELLDEAAASLEEAGTSFGFPLSEGFSEFGFDNPQNFAQFNRGLRARVAIYQEDSQGALNALADSFLNESATTLLELDVGPSHSFSLDPGDDINTLSYVDVMYIHRSVEEQAEPGDLRVERKLQASSPSSFGEEERKSSFVSGVYVEFDSWIPILRNEELLLLRAEAYWRLGNFTAAAADLNRIRTVSAGLPARNDLNSEAAIEDELLASRRYSLLLEGGHRWIDLRRFDRLGDIVRDFPTDTLNVRYPIPTGECGARKNEPACSRGSL